MAVQRCDTNRSIEIVDEMKLRTTISTSESIAIPNKARVYKQTLKHFTDIKEKDIPSAIDRKELYYPLQEGKEIPLDKFRLVARDNRGKQMILDGLLEIIYLVSEGKLYSIELNPMNFIAEDRPEVGKVFIKAFYRESKGLREITDEWLLNVKKLIGYFLVSDTGFNEENFTRAKPQHFLNSMEGHVKDQYLKIIRSSSVDQMARDWFTDGVYQQLKGFPPIMKDFRKPKDVTSVGVNILGNEEVEPLNPYPTQEIVEEQEEDKTVNENPKEEQTRRKKVTPATYRKPPMGKGKKFLLFLLGALVGGYIVYYLFISNAHSITIGTDFYNGLVSASVQKYDKASAEFNKILLEETEKLDEDQKMAMFFTYLVTEQYDKALMVEQDGGESVIAYLMEKDELEEVKNMDSNLPPIRYEKAVLDKDWEQIIQLKDQVRDTERRQHDVLEALVMTGDIENAVKYAEQKEIEGAKDKLKGFYDAYTKQKDVSTEEMKKASDLIDTL